SPFAGSGARSLSSAGFATDSGAGADGAPPDEHPDAPATRTPRNSPRTTAERGAVPPYSHLCSLPIEIGGRDHQVHQLGPDEELDLAAEQADSRGQARAPARRRV